MLRLLFRDLMHAYDYHHSLCFMLHRDKIPVCECPSWTMTIKMILILKRSTIGCLGNRKYILYIGYWPVIPFKSVSAPKYSYRLSTIQKSSEDIRTFQHQVLDSACNKKTKQVNLFPNSLTEARANPQGTKHYGICRATICYLDLCRYQIQYFFWTVHFVEFVMDCYESIVGVKAHLWLFYT